jgi:hypothetical protein
MSQLQSKQQAGQSNSTFLALILIGVGVIWLLGQANIFGGASFAVLARFWPLILVAIGANLLIGRGSPRISLLIGIITVAVFLLLMLIGPQLGLAQVPEVKTAAYQEPVNGAESARINLDLSLGTTTVSALSDSNELITADLRYLGELRFDVQGQSQRTVHLSTVGDVSGGSYVGFPFFNVGSEDTDLRWTIGLNPDVPMDVVISGGVGQSTLDFRNIQLTNLDLNVGVGETHLTLPAPDSAYGVTVDGGVGRVTITIVEGAAVRLDVNGGVGETVIDVPDNAPVSIMTRSGLGGISVPGGFTVIRQDNNNSEWQSPSFADAAASERIVIDYNGGVGGLSVR